jgi:hypothetical protein
MSSHFGSVPWTRQERALLSHCVASGFDWIRCSDAVKHLGTRVLREPQDCQREYGLMLDKWALATRVCATTSKFSEGAKRERVKQLEQRIDQRQVLVERMSLMAETAQSNADVERFVRACVRDVRTARMFGRGEDMLSWRETFADEDEGFGPFSGRAQLVARPLVAAQLPRPVEPFVVKLRFLPPAPVHGWPPAELRPATPTDATFLLSVFETIAGHRAADPFQDLVKGLPEYDAVVKQPVSFGTLRPQLHSGLITSALQLLRMLELMLANAFIFNARGSRVWESAEQLQAVISRELEPLILTDTIARI